MQGLHPKKLIKLGDETVQLSLQILLKEADKKYLRCIIKYLADPATNTDHSRRCAIFQEIRRKFSNKSEETKSYFDSNPSVMDHLTFSFNTKGHLTRISSEFN